MTVMVSQVKLDQSSGTTGWSAELDLEIARLHGKSVVCRSHQRGPLTIQRPFYPEADVCHLYVLHPPAGIVGGDRLHLKVASVREGGALLTTPGATKFYRSNGKQASQTQQFTVSDGASLEWLPQETIYFPGAEAVMKTEVHLQGSGRFIGWEINCLGLPASGKDFGNGEAAVSMRVFRDGRPILIESLLVSKDKQPYQAAFLRGQDVFGTFYAAGADESLLSNVRERIRDEQANCWGATLLDELLVIRYLGPSVNEARSLFIRAWRILRPLLLDREAVLPRIWST